jgi:hypothetical protein
MGETPARIALIAGFSEDGAKIHVAAPGRGQDLSAEQDQCAQGSNTIIAKHGMAPD